LSETAGGFSNVNKIFKACKEFKQLVGLNPDYETAKIFMLEGPEVL
jgi:hypothetical protein